MKYTIVLLILPVPRLVTTYMVCSEWCVQNSAIIDRGPGVPFCKNFSKVDLGEYIAVL